MIRREFDRVPNRKQVRLTHDQKEKIKHQFTYKELWETVRPPGFKGDKIDYLIFVRNEKKEKKLLMEKKLQQMDMLAMKHKRNKTMILESSRSVLSVSNK